MGIYIRLSIQPHKISSEAWRSAYEETLVVLRESPVELMGMKSQSSKICNRTVYTRDIENDPEDFCSRHWHIVGDYGSRETAESFEMYCDLKYYRRNIDRRSNRKEPSSHILVSIASEASDDTNLFDNKTQGYPYHLPLLAVAMLVEDRFPNHAFVHGDINIQQALAAQEMLREILGREIALPICVDAPRLFKKLQEYYSGESIFSHFSELYRGSLSEEMSVALELSDRNEFIDWFLEKFNGYCSPSQWGVIDLLSAWLSATKDLKTLCELACFHEKGPHYDPVEFASAIASTWVTIPPANKGDVYSQSSLGVDTVASQLESVILDLGGFRGRKISVYMNENYVLNMLSEMFPDQEEQIKTKFLAEVQEIKERVEEMVAVERKREEVQGTVTTLADPERGNGHSFLVTDAFDDLSKNQIGLLRGMAQTLARLRREIQERRPDYFEGTLEKFRTRVCQKTAETIILDETAWEWLENEEDPNLLQLLMTSLLIDTPSLLIHNIRTAMFEHRELCKLAYTVGLEAPQE